MKAKEMRDMPDHDLKEQIGELRRELLDLRLANATGQLEDTAKLPRTKRQLARSLTIAHERALGIDAAGGTGQVA
jgi:large subunit ribosomal protein L29